MDLETNRLVMRPINDRDFAQLHSILTEPGVRRYLCDDVIIPESQTRDFITRSGELLASEGGSGLWGVRRKGELSVASTDTPNVASIALLEKLGFALTEQRMAKGLATSFFELREG